MIGSSFRWSCFVLTILLGSGFAARVQSQQLTADEQAAQLLDAARRAHNEGNLPFAIDRFKQFLQQYGGHKDAFNARLGLGIALLESRTPEYQQAIDQLRPAAEAANFESRAMANYYYAAGYRGLGHAALVQAAQKPGEAQHFRNLANQQFEQAIKGFEVAATAFLPRLKAPLATDAELKLDFEWAARAQLDLIEMQFRVGKSKDALANAQKLCAVPQLADSRYEGLANYYLGYGLYSSGDYAEALRVLAKLAPFDNAAYGPHARYMLGRSHHLLDEHPEAQAQYDRLLATFADELVLAKQVAGNGELLKNNPAERARLLILANTPPPDYVARSWFYSAVIAYEQERFSEALEKFTKFATDYKTSSLLNEALLRKGFCQVRLKQFNEATQTLAPLQDEPQLGDQSRWWLARAQVGLSITNPTGTAQHLTAAIDQFRRAADKANQITQQDPAAKLRRQDMLIELADAFQSNKQFGEAVQVYQQVLNEQPAADRAELASQRITAALHLAGKFKESDEACQKFAKTYPESSLLPAVMFRVNENALAIAEAAFAAPPQPDLPQGKREATLKPLYDDVIAKSTRFLEAYPESADAKVVRHALGLATYRLGDFEKAATIFSQIPVADRSGEILTASYFLADCLLRTSPETAEDALASGQLIETSSEIVKLLDGFIAASPPTSTLIPDALVKLGDAHLRMASVIEVEQERNLELQAARQCYEKVMQQFGQHPMNAVAVYERARLMIAQKDLNGAMNEYRRFLQDPLRSSAVAPMAVLRLATMLREQKKPQEAIDPLSQTRSQHEAALIADPARAAWAPMLVYYQAVCLREAAKWPEAQAMFETIVQRFPHSPEANDAIWRIEQCKKDIVLTKLEPARVTLARKDAPQNEVEAARGVVADSMTKIAAMAKVLEQHATLLDTKAPGSEAQLSTLYEAAWCYRLLGEQEAKVAQEKIRTEGQKTRQDELAKLASPGRAPVKAAMPDVPFSAVPLQPAEIKARELYTALIEKGGEQRLVGVAQLELAEVHALREEFAAAAKVLEPALSAVLAQDLADKIRIRYAAILIGLNQGAEAQAEVQAMATDDKHPRWAEARYLVGEALINQKQWKDAIEILKMFRDEGRLHNVPGVSDRAMFRLAYAYEQSVQWEPARQAYETLFNRYAQSPWRLESRYGMGYCLQKQSQWDGAVNQYSEVIRSTTDRTAAQAQYQIGVCRAAQQRWQESADAFQLCAYTYDSPELCAQSLVDASASLVQLKKFDDASKLLNQVAKEYGYTKAVVAAKEQLAKLPLPQ